MGGINEWALARREEGKNVWVHLETHEGLWQGFVFVQQEGKIAKNRVIETERYSNFYEAVAAVDTLAANE